MNRTVRPIPKIADLIRMEPQLHSWTEMAARAYGLHEGLNLAIKESRDKWPSVAHHASDIRQEMALMALIRSFAVMDREAQISFQSVYRYLSIDSAGEEVAAVYAASDPPCSLATARVDTSAAKTRFLEAYGETDFRAFSRIQSFRNNQIAHISWPEAEAAKVTYADLERLVVGCCKMAGELTLMLTGRNDWPEELLTDSRQQAYRFWLAAIRADAENRLHVEP
ncbi:hypothetical protein GHK03_00495 [Sinorhizobium medicae]|uniref:hypothetical protein n=1 Tax=Sinorhizobium medicae TaxID=110321 RepID=UPI00129686D9|nr:hypothetical protein [Sinorhizobium medicae]MQX94745.1 hypothetical protein [Sinorhizobium medicae]